MCRRLRRDLSPDRAATAAAPPAWSLALQRRARVIGVANAHHEEVGGFRYIPRTSRVPLNRDSRPIHVSACFTVTLANHCEMHNEMQYSSFILYIVYLAIVTTLSVSTSISTITRIAAPIKIMTHLCSTKSYPPLH